MNITSNLATSYQYVTILMSFQSTRNSYHISKENLLKVISDLSSLKTNYDENSLYNLGIRTNTWISLQEREKISSDSTSFMLEGIRNIVENSKDNIKQTECRSPVDLMAS